MPKNMIRKSLKTNTGLASYAKAQLGLPYWYGTFGNVATEALYNKKKTQYPKYYNWSGTPYNNFPQQYGLRVHDCVGLIKGYLWSDTPSSVPIYDALQDVSANGMRSKCKDKGSIDTIPDIPGILVFMTGHVGVYIGNDEVIEARGHEYGVVKTHLKSRPWKWWGKCPYIIYPDNTVTSSTATDIAPTQSGEKVKINCKRVKLKPGNWNVRKLPSTDSPAVAVLKGSSEISVAKGWVYVPSCDGFISEKAIDQQ